MQTQIVAKTNEAFKAAEEIYNRLLNHRHFTSGELRYFVREFEERRNDKEVDELNNSLETTKKINESIETFPHREKSELSRLNDVFGSLIETGNKIIAFEKDGIESRKQTMEDKLLIRIAEVERISSENQVKFQEIDEYFAIKEAEMKKFYDELESNWNLNSLT
ncbi:Biogenesis of lysosome-related organelles complex 1 subunit 5-like protein [Leptotrombidium deliense]|uniref:Biogenesis of lysosome-related organelles complex 1 subunit 5 n=1 Tax=Leptotrombidium deliense TaxID=299467 RepID=A0A443S7B2_9ACAR|nr:Biogenesis of lysosome-related organelles complex 1 subunit 5-like protein [Leptotrombidium deliense]